MNKGMEGIKVKMELIGKLNRLIDELEKIRGNFEKEWIGATGDLSTIHEKYTIELKRVAAEFTDISKKLFIEMEISHRLDAHER